MDVSDARPGRGRRARRCLIELERGMNASASFLALFIVALGYGVIVPLGPTLVREAMGPVAAQAISFHTGALSAAYLLAFAALAPLWGRVADVAARRVIAAAGLGGFALSFAVMAAAPGMTVLYPALIVGGAAAAAVVPAIQVQIGRVDGDLAKARLLTALGAASFAGWFLGPPLASWSIGLGQARGFSAASLPLGVIAILGFAAAIFAVYAIPAGPPFAGGDEGQAAPRPFTRGAWQFGLLAMAVAFGLGGFEVSLVLWILQVMRLDAGQVSRLLVECTVVMMVVQAAMFFLPAARPRWNPAGAAAAFTGMATAVALTPLATGVIAMSALVVVLAAAATALQAMLSFGTVTTAGNRPGGALGLQLSLTSVGQGLGSFSAGALFSASGGGFYASAALLAVAAFGAGAMSRGPPTRA